MMTTETTAAPNVDATGTLHLPGKSGQTQTATGDQAISTGGFSPEQARTIAGDLDYLVSCGRMTREEADKALAAEGVELVKPEEGLSPDAAEIDKAFPPARPQDYEFPQYNGPGEGLTAEQAKFDATARGWLADAKFTREIGSSLAIEIDREARAHQSMSDIDRLLYGKQQQILLERLWGTGTADKISMARQLVRELDARRPGLIALLEATGAGNNARLIAALANQAERLALRRAK